MKRRYTVYVTHTDTPDRIWHRVYTTTNRDDANHELEEINQALVPGMATVITTLVDDELPDTLSQRDVTMMRRWFR